MPYTTASDGCRLYYDVKGKADGQALFVTYPWTDALLEAMAELTRGNAEEIKKNARSFIDGLGEHYKLVIFDYPRGVGQSERKEGDLTADTVASDYLTIADAAGVDRFVALGYSWSANAALQVAIRTPRCAGVAIGGWPPLSGPYEALLDFMTKSNGGLSGWVMRTITRNKIIRCLIPKNKRTALTNAANMMESVANYYKSVVGQWNEEEEIAKLTKGPRITYFGSDDNGAPNHNLVVPLAENNRKRKDDLERLGWRVVEIPGYDHETLMQDSSGMKKISSLLLNELEPYQW